MRNRRTFTLQVCGERVESHVKLMTNFEEVSYWKSNGRLEEEVEYNGRRVRLLTANDLVENCILLNEVKVMGLQAVAVPFMIRSYKKTGFVKERLMIKASYPETSIKQRASA